MVTYGLAKTDTAYTAYRKGFFSVFVPFFVYIYPTKAATLSFFLILTYVYSLDQNQTKSIGMDLLLTAIF